MTFKEVLAQVIHWLQQDKGLSYRALKRQCAFDDDLDALQAELIEVRHVAGDGLLVYFDYPLAHEDAAQQAARCGLEWWRPLGNSIRT